MHMLIYRLMSDNESHVFSFASATFAYKFLVKLQSKPIWWSLWEIGEEIGKDGQLEHIFVDSEGIS